MTTTIVILGRKGGVGKTTVAKTLAEGCALQGFRTLLVDADGQGNSSAGMKVKPFDAFYQLIMKNAEWKDVLLQVPQDHLETDNLYLLCASDAQRIVEQYKPHIPGEPSVATRIYNRFKEIETYFDVIIVDTSPGITNVHSAMYFTADYALLPVQCERDSITSLGSSISYINEAQRKGEDLNMPTVEIMGIIPNMYEKRESVQIANVGYIQGRYHDHLIFTPISKKTVWKQASQLQVSIYNLQTQMFERRDQKKAVREFQPILDAVIDKVQVGETHE